MSRTFWKTDRPLQNKPTKGWRTYPAGDDGTLYEMSSKKEATLIGSSTGVVGRNGPIHMPAIDIDLPCELVESSTPGHFHLYIDKEMPWEQYKELLYVMSEVGIVERGYYDASVARGQSFLRKPGLKK